MRVAHVITRLILGGAQENVVLNCEDLARDYGDDVLLITGPPLGPEGSLLDRVRNSSAGQGQGRAGGLRLEMIDSLRRSIHPWRDLTSYRALMRSLREFKPDVVHTHSAKAGILGRAAADHLRVPAIVHTVHGAPFHDYQSWPARLFCQSCERWAARRCHALVSVADAMTERMVAAGVAPREKFTTIYSGMEVEPLLAAEAHRSATRKSLGYNDDHVVMVNVARLFHLKGHDYLIAAMADLAPRHPNLRLLLVGDGILRTKIERQIAQSGLGKQIQLLGLVPAEQIAALLAASDLVVHTSLREGLARAVVAGLIAARPAVSFDIDGAREVVIDNETGFLVPPRDIPRLIHSIDRLVDDSELRWRLGENGRARFTDQFRHERMTAAIRRLYLSLLEGPCVA